MAKGVNMKGAGHRWGKRMVETLYPCKDCGLLFREREWAEKCYAWCVKHKSCNLQITSHAVK